MRQCLTRRICLRKLVQPTKPTCPARLQCAAHLRRKFTTTTSNYLDKETRHTAPAREFLKYDVFNRMRAPRQDEWLDPAVWVSLLESGLPSHLREDAGKETSTTLNASDIAEILIAAQRLTPFGKETDLLVHLGTKQGRWRAVVWLVKHLVETFAPRYSEPERLKEVLCPWSVDKSLEELTRNVINIRELAARPSDDAASLTNLRSLEELTDDSKPEKLSRENILWHDALGSIWRSLGIMTIECAGGEIRPEILEIIAYLHHMEFMPSSIYNQKPSADPTAIQQPLMLHLLSSRILTSLSDAAWRAHAKTVVEEAEAKGGRAIPLRPEIPGMAYRVNVAGLRPEVWLELILWSCLHGGWIHPGTAILRAACAEREQEYPKDWKWRAVSWRTLVDYDSQDWGEIEHFLNAPKSSPANRDAVLPTHSVRRTLSSEVVNAYVDALLSTIRLGVGERGVAPGTVLEHLRALQDFLGRSGLALETGSWDAVVLRFADSQEAVFNRKGWIEWLVNLSPTMGEEIQPSRARSPPGYVFDGSAAVLGLFHQALRARIKAGDVKGAFRLFESFQMLADRNKEQSVVDFLRKQQLLADDETESENTMFMNNFSGIEYPVFDVQIPSTILGPFLELITDAKAYDFGKWLLYSDEIDGPVLQEQNYGDPAVTPALVRFAAETNDTALLSKLIQARSPRAQEDEPSKPRNVLQSFFDSQVNLRRWDAAVRILDHMKHNRYAHWNCVSLAHVIRVMLLQVRLAESGDQEGDQNLARAQDLLSDMVQGRYEREGERPKVVQVETTLLLTILSTLNRHWAEYSLRVQSLHGAYLFKLPTKAFNLVLEGAVDAFGHVAGRRLLDVFWPHSTRDAPNIGQRRAPGEDGEPVMSRFIPSTLDSPDRKRTVIKIPGSTDEEVIIYGGLEPDLMTIHIIFRKAVDEFTQSAIEDGSPTSCYKFPFEDSGIGGQGKGDPDLSPSDTIVWAIGCFRSLGMEDRDIRDELSKALPEDKLAQIIEKVPTVLDAASNQRENTEEEPAGEPASWDIGWEMGPDRREAS